MLTVIVDNDAIFTLHSLSATGLTAHRRRLTDRTHLLTSRLDAFRNALHRDARHLDNLFRGHFDTNLDIRPSRPIDITNIRAPKLRLNDRILGGGFRRISRFGRVATNITAIFIHDNRSFVHIDASLDGRSNAHTVNALLSRTRPTCTQLVTKRDCINHTLLFRHSCVARCAPIESADNGIVTILFMNFSCASTRGTRFTGLRHFHVNRANSLTLLSRRDG